MTTSEIRDTRWAMGLGIRAGKALLRAENALSNVIACGAHSDFDTMARLRAARCDLNHLAKEISRLVYELEKAHDKASQA